MSDDIHAGPEDRSSWPRLLYGQTDLPERCRARTSPGVDLHPQNHMYGNASLVKEYAGLSHDQSSAWAMEHHITFGNPAPNDAEATTCLPCVLAVTEDQAEAIRRLGKPWVLPVGFSFFYMRELFHRRHPSEPRDGNPRRRGTLVFPDKSTGSMDTDFDRERFAKELAALPDEFQPVAVSIFWRDYERGTHRPFEDAGLLLVSSGNNYDPDFLFRQYDLCRQFRYACANDISTSFCLSVLAGCEFFHLPAGSLRLKLQGVEEVYQQDPTMALPGKQACLASAPFPPRGNHPAQLALAERFAGKAFERSPEFFRRLDSESRAALARMRPRSLILGQEQSTHEIVLWQPRGFDRDGWGQKRCRLVIPPSAPGETSVRLHLDIPQRPQPLWQSLWSLFLDGVRLRIPVRAGLTRLEIRCRSDDHPRELLFECDSEVQLLDELRQRAFHLAKITWRAAAGRCDVRWSTAPEGEDWHESNAIPEDSRFTGHRTPWALVAPWLLEGVAADGWAGSGAGFSLPSREGFEGLRLKLMIPARADPGWSATWTVALDEGRRGCFPLRVSAGRWLLEIRAPAAGTAVSVTFDCAGGTSPDEVPHQVFRITEMTWRPRLKKTTADTLRFELLA